MRRGPTARPPPPLPPLPQLLTGPGGGAIIDEYEELLDALLKRAMDTEAGWLAAAALDAGLPLVHAMVAGLVAAELLAARQACLWAWLSLQAQMRSHLRVGLPC